MKTHFTLPGSSSRIRGSSFGRFSFPTHVSSSFCFFVTTITLVVVADEDDGFHRHLPSTCRTCHFSASRHQGRRQPPPAPTPVGRSQAHRCPASRRTAR